MRSFSCAGRRGGHPGGQGAPFAAAVREWSDNLFAPGANEFLLALISAAPFVVLAVFSLFHLSAENRGRRTAGVCGALIFGAGLAVQVHASIRMSVSSTAAIGFLVLPFEEVIVMPLGYGVGRLAASLVRKGTPRISP